MYTLDANIFLRDLDTRDTDYAVCHAVLERLHRSATPVIVPLLLLVEVAGALSRELHDPMRGRLAVSLLQGLPYVSFVALDESLAQGAAELAADCALRGADALYVAVAQRYATTLVTLDREVRERASRVVPTCTPNELLARLSEAS